MPEKTDNRLHYDYIISLVYARCGVRLNEEKHPLIQARLAKRMRLLGYENLGHYCEYLKGREGELERDEVVDCLTTSFTHFFREEDHFRFLVEEALPELSRPKRHTSFQIWSAACATGEEPYSLAMYLGEYYPPNKGWEWRLLATDVSRRALKKAQAGVYPIDRAANVPHDWLKKYFLRGTGVWEGHCHIKPEWRERIDFQRLNLLSDYELGSPFEMIFCRNAMIYFDRETQEQLVQKLLQYLVPGGFLIVGHSESLTGIRAALKCRRPSIYQKV